MKIKKIFKTAIVAVSAIITAILPQKSHAQTLNDDDDFELIKNLEIFHTLMQNVRIMYVDEVSSGELIKTAMDKMLASIDPYTVYYPESLVEDVRFMQTGDYAGVGIEVMRIGDDVVINAVHKDSPADKTGLMIGDKIISINGKETKGKSHDELDLIIKGQPGTNVSITIDHLGKIQTVPMKRAMINIPDIPYYGEVADGIGYINLSSFTMDCSKEFQNAFLKLKNDSKIQKLIIDLRHNPGGLLVEAVKIINIFIDKGEPVVDMRGRVTEWNKIFKTESAALDTEIPIVVLVNGNSASAAEIVSGSLQDLDRAVILGEKTYGKGLVQTTRDLVFNSRMKITTAKYYIPSGRCIQKLDYSHKDSTGKASQISESQGLTFKTKNGRPVKDAGGIMPDILVNSDTLSYFVENLMNGHHLFHYANAYKQKHPESRSPEDFNISDSDLADFRAWAGSRIYDYKTPADEELDALEKRITEEYSAPEMRNTIKNLRGLISAQKQKEFDIHKEELRLALGSEIIRRYYYDEGVLRYTLKHDPFIDRAVEVLNNAVLYNKILSGK